MDLSKDEFNLILTILENSRFYLDWNELIVKNDHSIELLIKRIRKRLNEMNTYEITINGCHDYTTVILDLYKSELKWIEYLAIKCNEQYDGCKPTIDIKIQPEDKYIVDSNEKES